MSGQHDPEARVDADQIIEWAARLGVTPEELRSAVQKGGAMVRDVVAELARRGLEADSSAGSTTNASDAVDDIHLPSHPTGEQLLDEGIKETFPASDPVAVPTEGETVWERRRRGR
jgi:hypothetical protein